MDILGVQGISRYRWIYMEFRGYPDIGGYTRGSGDIQVYVDMHGVQEISRYKWIYLGFRGYPGISGYTWSSGDIQV